MLRLAFALTAVLTILASHPVLAAPPSAATLTGEMLFTADPTDIPPFLTDCDQSGTSTFSYTVRGPATGPYPGTFTETGTVTMGPHFPEITPFGTLIHARVTSWTADFEILSPAGLVRGSKVFSGAPAGFARCVDGPPAVLAPYTDRTAFALLTYEVRIHTAQGVFWDRGITTPHISQCNCGSATGFGRVASFLETYRSDLATASRGRGAGFRP